MIFTNIITYIVTLPFKHLIALWFIMLMSILYIYYSKKKFNKEDVKQSKEQLQLYLDQYFITNKVLIFFLCSLYIFGISLIFILLRYMYLGQITPLQASGSILLYVFNAFKLFVTISFYKIILDLLFTKELNKVFLYIESFINFSYYFNNIISYKIGENIFGSLRVLCYRIATFTYKNEEYIPGNLPYFIHSREFQYFQYTQKWQPIANKAQDLAEQYHIVQKIFAFFAYILRFVHIHISEVNKQLPSIILVLIFLYELYHKEFRYLYLASFIVLLVKTKHNIESYISNRDGRKDSELSYYFYRNEVPYAIQRMSFIQNKDITININTDANRSLFMFSESLFDYCEANFKMKVSSRHRRLEAAHRRYLITILFIFITMYMLCYNSYHIESIIFQNIPTIILFLPLLIIIYSGHKAYYPTSYQEDPNDAEWIYSVKWNIIYWIMLIIQGYLLWTLLIAPEILIPDSEVIFDFSIRIIKIYTIEEKIIYLYQYFDYYIQLTALPIEEQDLLRYKLRQVNFQEIINEITTLKDIKYNLRYWITEEYYKDHVAIIERIMRLYTEKQNSWYDLLRNIIVILGIHTGIYKAISYYDELFIIIARLQDPYQLYLIANEIKQSTLSVLIGRFYIFIGIIVKDRFPSILDIILYYGLDYIPLQIRLILMSIIFGLFGTFYLPDIIHSFEKPVATEIKVSVILLEDMSTVPIIASYNLYYFIGVFVILLFISISFIIKKKIKSIKKLQDKKPINDNK